MANIDLFGHNVPGPKIKVKKLVPVKPIILNQFAIPEDRPVYIGQNLYIRPNYIVSMPEFSKAKNYSSQAFIQNKENLVDNKHKGVLSDKAIKDIRCCVNWLVASAKLKTIWHKESQKYYSFKVNFITLTLPDTYAEITDVILKKDLLNPLLTTLRKGYGLKNYLWKLEFQQNGKLHIHITTDTFIYWKDLRRLWNRRLVSCGHMAKFQSEFGHSDPNSTDVHAVYKINDIAAYISKYMSKVDPLLSKVKGRIWQCNYELARNSKPRIFVPVPDLQTVLQTLYQPIVKFSRILSKPDGFGCVRELGEIFLIKPVSWLMDIKGDIKALFNQTCWNIRNLRNPIGFNSEVLSLE